MSHKTQKADGMIDLTDIWLRHLETYTHSHTYIHETPEIHRKTPLLVNSDDFSNRSKYLFFGVGLDPGQHSASDSGRSESLPGNESLAKVTICRVRKFDPPHK